MCRNAYLVVKDRHGRRAVLSLKEVKQIIEDKEGAGEEGTQRAKENMKKVMAEIIKSSTAIIDHYKMS